MHSFLVTCMNSIRVWLTRLLLFSKSFHIVLVYCSIFISFVHFQADVRETVAGKPEMSGSASTIHSVETG